MSYRKVSGLAAAVGTALALAGSAYADQGKSPNGPPGPEGNPNNPPAAQPQANAPQGPAGNESQGNSNSQSKGRSESRGKSQSAPNNAKPKSKSKGKSKSRSNHANPNPGTPRKGGREDRPADKITICHATHSETNPYVEITISENGLNGHGHHHDRGWDDIIPAPATGCPTTVQSGVVLKQNAQSKTTTDSTQTGAGVTAPAPGQRVLGAQAEGGSPAAASEVLGAAAEGGEAPAAAVAAQKADKGGSLPFTGLELIVVLAAAAAALLAGFALRRALGAGQA